MFFDELELFFFDLVVVADRLDLSLLSRLDLDLSFKNDVTVVDLSLDFAAGFSFEVATDLSFDADNADISLDVEALALSLDDDFATLPTLDEEADLFFNAEVEDLSLDLAVVAEALRLDVLDVVAFAVAAAAARSNRFLV